MNSFWQQLYKAHKACPACASPAEVASFFSDLLGIMFPEFRKFAFASETDFEAFVSKIRIDLRKIVVTNIGPQLHADTIVDQFFNELPNLHTLVNEDVTAMFEGDPAASSREEVIRTYPGFYAIAAYRVAHALHRGGVTGIPRIITEHAHSKTGVDIHPSASIGRHFCIDHGTGIVIGETAVIGDRVKIYQGVTLGALSVSKEDASRKRHPTIESDVVMYAGATILGGETTIGHHSIIGGNVWLTSSVPPHSKIYYQSKMHHDDLEQTDMVIFRPSKQRSS